MRAYNWWMQSPAKSSPRRMPKQERATARRDALLDAAAGLFAEKGYGGATMTAVAQRAGASIGTLYEYFPDKHTLANALAKRYTQEADIYWAALLKEAEFATSLDLAQLFVNGMLDFIKGHPSYAALLNAPTRYARSDQERRPLRMLFAKALRLARPEISNEQSLLSCRIIVELLKALLSVHGQVTMHEREAVTQRFRDLVTFHITKGES